MPADIQKILGYDSLSGSYEAVKTGIPSFLPAGFDAVKARENDNTARFVSTNGVRNLALVRQYGAKQQPADDEAVGEKLFTMISGGESHRIDPQKLLNLTNPDTGVVGAGAAWEVDRILRNVKTRHENLRAFAKMQALSAGKIYLSVKNVLDSSSGAIVTVDYGRTTATNEGAGQEVDGSTALTGQAWNTASTDIQGELRTIKTTAVKRTGYPLRYCFFGANVPGYLYKNTGIKNAINGAPAASDAQLSGGVPNIQSLEWIDGSQAFWIDADGDYQEFVGENEILLCPDPALGFWGVVEGTEYANMASGVVASPEAANAAVMAMPGMQVYAEMASDALAGYNVKSLDTFLPALMVPDATYKLTVQS